MTEAVKRPAGPKKGPASAAPSPVPSLDMSQKLVGRIAMRYGVEPGKLLGVLRDTVFRPPSEKRGSEWVPGKPFSDDEMAAALVLADKYDLNPFAKEIYITRSKGALLVIVGVDGWVKIVNREPRFQGMEEPQFAWSEDTGKPYSCTVTMHVKGWKVPCRVTEYFSECYRESDRRDAPWNSHPARMLRHKAYIQCARLAFGISGLHDPDEAEQILYAEARIVPSKQLGAPARSLEEPRPTYLEDALRGVPASVAQRPEVREEVEAAQLPPDVPLEEKREPGEERLEVPGLPLHAEVWAAWEALRPRLSEEQLNEVRKAAGSDLIRPGLPVEQLHAAVKRGEQLLGGK